MSFTRFISFSSRLNRYPFICTFYFCPCRVSAFYIIYNFFTRKLLFRPRVNFPLSPFGFFFFCFASKIFTINSGLSLFLSENQGWGNFIYDDFRSFVQQKIILQKLAGTILKCNIIIAINIHIMTLLFSLNLIYRFSYCFDAFSRGSRFFFYYYYFFDGEESRMTFENKFL